MRKWLAGIVVLGALFAISPALASANTVTASCNGGSCDGWFNATDVANAGGSIPLAFTFDTTPDVGTSGCDPASFSTEGQHPFDCVANWSTDPMQAEASGAVKIDLTPPSISATPSRGPDLNGWYNHPFSVTFTGTDATSGPASQTCGTPSYTGPPTSGDNLSAICTDAAGNSASKSYAFKYDDTTPGGITGIPTVGPNANGWYNAPVPLTFGAASTGPSGATCSAPAYAGPDGSGVHGTGTCTSGAGKAANGSSSAFNYDSTPPSVTGGGPTRAPDSNGWYNHPVAVALIGTDATSGVAPGGCSTVVYSGPSSAGARASGTCTDKAGNVSAPGQSGAFKYDSVPPEISGANASRAPDYNGWYNHPVSFTFTGNDAVSGIAAGSCSTVTYSGGDSSKATVKGSCRDLAGNTGSGSQSFKYDSTPPAKATLKGVPGNHTIDLSWSLPSDATGVTVLRSQQGSAAPAAAVYKGNASAFTDKKLVNGVKYRYTVIDIDQAGNQNTQTIVVAPTASSLRPLVGAIVSSAPILTWKKVKKATYYNLQLYRGSKKVLSTWPRKPSLQIANKWRFAGKKYKLSKGHYRWYVWPGFGAEKRHKYGKLLGASTFRVI